MNAAFLLFNMLCHKHYRLQHEVTAPTRSTGWMRGGSLAFDMGRQAVDRDLSCKYIGYPWETQGNRFSRKIFAFRRFDNPITNPIFRILRSRSDLIPRLEGPAARKPPLLPHSPPHLSATSHPSLSSYFDAPSFLPEY